MERACGGHIYVAKAKQCKGNAILFTDDVKNGAGMGGVYQARGSYDDWGRCATASDEVLVEPSRRSWQHRSVVIGKRRQHFDAISSPRQGCTSAATSGLLIAHLGPSPESKAEEVRIKRPDPLFGHKNHPTSMTLSTA